MHKLGSQTLFFNIIIFLKAIILKIIGCVSSSIAWGQMILPSQVSVFGAMFWCKFIYSTPSRNMKISKKQVCRKEGGSCEMVYVNFQANTYINFCHIAKNAIFLNRSQEIMVSIGVLGAEFWWNLIPQTPPRNMKISKKQVCRYKGGSCEMVSINFQANPFIIFCHIAKNAIFFKPKPRNHGYKQNNYHSWIFVYNHLYVPFWWPNKFCPISLSFTDWHSIW